MVDGVLPGQMKEISDEQKLEELARMEMIVVGQGWRLPDRPQRRMVESFWKSTVDQWQHVSGFDLINHESSHTFFWHALCGNA